MSSEKVNNLKVLINKKINLERFHAVCEGLHYISIFMLVFYLITYTQGDLPYLSFWGLVFFFGFILNSVFEKKGLEIKRDISKILFKDQE